MSSSFQENVTREFDPAGLTDTDGEYRASLSISPIMPYIFIGTWDNACDLDMLRSKQITVCINVSPQRHQATTLAAMRGRGISSFEYPVVNTAETPLLPACEFVWNVLSKARNEKRNILVYCNQGFDTSPAVIAYVCLQDFYGKQIPTKNMLRDIFKLIYKQRGHMAMNVGFIEQLEDEEARRSGRPAPRAGDVEAGAGSMSIRRNPQQKQKENRVYMQTVEAEKKFAEKNWEVTAIKRY